MKKIFFLMFALLLSATMFAQEGRTPIFPQYEAEKSTSLSEDFFSPLTPNRALGYTVWCEGFEGLTTTTFPPTGWTIYGNPSTFLFGYYATGGRTAPGCFGYGAGSSTRPTYGITTPSVTAVNGAVLSFWTTVGTTYNPGTYYTAYRIKVSTTNNLPASFTTIKEYSNFAYTGIHTNNVIYTPVANTWYEMTADLSAYAGQTIYLAIEILDGWGNDNIKIDDVCVKVLPDNDLAVIGAVPFNKVPVTQNMHNLTARVTNLGSSAQSNVTVSVTLNGAPLATSAPLATLAAGAVANITIPVPAATAIPLGVNTVVYTVSQTEPDDDLSNNTFTEKFTGTTILFAADESHYWNVGNSSAISLGNVYEINQPTRLDGVELQFGTVTSTTIAYTISLYNMAGGLPVSPAIFTTTSTTRPTASHTVKHAVPVQNLVPGSYFLCVNQTGSTNMALGADFNPVRGGKYISGTAFGDIKAGFNNPNIGAPCVRMLVDLPANDIALTATSPIMPFTKIPTSQAPYITQAFPTSLAASVQNVGTAAQTGIVFSATLNGNPIGTSTTLANLNTLATSNMTITPTAGTVYPLTTPGTHNLVYNVNQSQTDINPADNTATFTLEVGTKYAMDAVTVCKPEDGLGGQLFLGSVFTVYYPTYINAVEIGLADATPLAYKVAIFKTNGTTAVTGDALFYVDATRSSIGFHTVTVPRTLLMPGTYFLAAEQLGGERLEVVMDRRTTNTAARCYSKAAGTATALTAQSFYGLAIRMITEDATDVADIKTTVSPAGAGTVTGAGYYVFGTPVTLTATPNFGYDFADWSTGETTPSITFNATASTTITANFVANGCQGKTIGTGTSLRYQAPVNTFYNYSYIQQIYDASEIGAVAPDMYITSIGFSYQYATATTKNPLTIYLANTTKTNFAGTTASDWEPFANLKQVFKGTVTFNNNSTWVTITLDVPFKYTGNNLVVAVLNNTGSQNTGSNATFRYTTTSPNYKTLSYRKDTPAEAIDPSTTITPSERMYERPNVFFGFCHESTLTQVDMRATTITGPTKVIASEPQNYNVSVKNGGMVDATSYKVSVLDEADNELASVIGTTLLTTGEEATFTLPVTFVEAQVPGVKIKGRVDIIGDEKPANNETALMNVEILTECAINLGDVNIGGNGLSAYYQLPINTYYDRSYTQQIFDAAELGLSVGSKITSIAFQYVYTVAQSKVNQSIYLGNVTKSIFANTTDWVPVSQLELVYSGTLNYNNSNPWFVINFDTPFTYTGNNIVVAFVNNSCNQPTGSNNTFRRVDAGIVGNKTIQRYYDDSAGTNPFDINSPGTASGTLAQRNNVIFGLLAESRELTLNPANVGDPKITLVPKAGVRCGTSIASFNSGDPCKYITDVKFDGVSKGVITQFEFSYDVLGTNVLPLIEVLTAYYQYDVTATSGPNGTVSPELQNLQCGTQATIYIQPDEGYTLDSLFFNGKYIKVSATTKVWKTPVITETSTVFVKFKVCPYNIVVNIVGNGLVELNADGDWVEVTSGNLGVDEGVPYLFKFTPNTGSELSSVKVDGILQPASVVSHSYVFPPVYANHTLDVGFKLKNMTINATTGPNGTVTPTGNVPVPYGSDKLFVIKANTGYVIDQLFVDGDEKPIADQLTQLDYIFYGVVANHTIYATFKVATMMVTIIPPGPEDGCGYVTPEGNNGVVYIPYNGIQIFTFVPCEGSKVIEVIVNGISKPAAIQTGSYTFYYTTEPQTIKVRFAPIQYAVKSSINDYGVITPNGTTMVDYGTDKEYTWYTFPGYKVANVFVDGINKPQAVIDGKYTFKDVKAPHTISVVTTQVVLNITATAGVGGSITPAGNISVVYGQNQHFTFKALPGYKIEKVLIDNVINAEAAINGSYTFLNLTKDNTIEVFFNKSRYMVEAIVSPGGNIEPAGITELTYFDEITYTITPEQGYEIKSVFVNGNNLGAINTFTFSEVETDGNIEALFSPVEEEEETGIDLYDSGISVYSNANHVYIDNKDLQSITDVSIYDMYGRIVWQGNVYQKHNTITLQVAAGIYSVRITTENGVFTASKVNIQK